MGLKNQQSKKGDNYVQYQWYKNNENVKKRGNLETNYILKKGKVKQNNQIQEEQEEKSNEKKYKQSLQKKLVDLEICFFLYIISVKQKRRHSRRSLNQF